MNLQQRPYARVYERADGGVLVVADLEEEMAVGEEKLRRFADEAANKVEAVAARRESYARLVVAHFTLETGHVTLGHVGRIGDDQVEARAGRSERGEAIRSNEMQALAHIMMRGVKGGDAQGG